MSHIKCSWDDDFKRHIVIYSREGMLDFFGKDEKLDKDGILRKIQNVTEEDEVRRVYHSHFY